jgi:hypothetical protein
VEPWSKPSRSCAPSCSTWWQLRPWAGWRMGSASDPKRTRALKPLHRVAVRGTCKE